MTDPLPPFSEADEAAALGCVLDCDNPEELFSQLSLDLFYDERHRAIFGIFHLLESISVVDAFQYANQHKLVEQCGGISYLNSLPERKHSVVNFPSWLNILKELAIRRAALRDSAQLSLIARDPAIPWTIVRSAAARMTRAYDVAMHEEEGIKARPIGEFELPSEDDSSELLKRRFLCERGSLLLTGPTGVGKSSLNMQALALWANGLPFFGITPTRPLTSILIQAENDDGDIAEFRNGICTGLEFNESQRKEFFHNVLVYTSNGLTGRQFCHEVLRKLLDRHTPNLVVIDPALSFLGGDVKEQKDVGVFLRQHINPELNSHNTAGIMVHHTNKPKSGNDDNAVLNGDWAYQGSGSAEWANWARATLSLQSSGEPGVYKIHAGKRGKRIGWKNAQDQIVLNKILIHSQKKGVICWEEGDTNDLPDRGRPKTYKQSDVVDLIGESGLETPEWQKRCLNELGISRATFHRIRAELTVANLIFKARSSDKWVKIIQKDSVS